MILENNYKFMQKVQMIYWRITVCFVVQFLASRIHSLIIVTNIDESKGAQPASAP